MMNSNISILFLALLLTQSISVHAQQQQIPNPTLGPPQVCRCYPAGAPGICPTTVPPTYTIFKGISRCQKIIKVDISFVAADGVNLYICGSKVGRSSDIADVQTITYEGPCDDFMLEVNNDHQHSSGVALFARFNGQSYGTTDGSGNFGRPETKPLFAISKFHPTGEWFMNPPDYDFSSWTPAVVVDNLMGVKSIYPFTSDGAYPLNVQRGVSPAGIYGLKLVVPFCQ